MRKHKYAHLVTIGKEWVKGERVFGQAAHPYWELVYVCKGQGLFTVGTKNYALKEGKLILVRPGVIHASRPVEKGYFLFCLFINFPAWDIIPQAVKSVEISVQESVIFEMLLARLQEYFVLSADKEVLSGLLCALIDILRIELSFKRFGVNFRMANIVSVAGKAMSFIEENYNKPVTVAAVAQKVHLGPSRLAHVFKEATNFSVIAYLLRYRINMAKHFLLSSPEAPIKAITQQVGFNNLNHFYLQFKKLAGMSPRRFCGLHSSGHGPFRPAKNRR